MIWYVSRYLQSRHITLLGSDTSPDVNTSASVPDTRNNKLRSRKATNTLIYHWILMPKKFLFPTGVVANVLPRATYHDLGVHGVSWVPDVGLVTIHQEYDLGGLSASA